MQLSDIKKIAVIGSGTMGVGMGLTFALAGREVVLQDIAQKMLDWASGRVESSLQVMVAEGLVSESDAEAAQGRISLTLDLAEAVRGAQYVLEAIPEKLEIKQDLFAQLEELCPPETILATNTSGLSITAIASGLKHPERVGGMHFFNPPDFVPLVEAIRGEQTSDETIRVIYDLIQESGKEGIIVNRDIPGFAGNRLQLAAYREALHLAASGVVSYEDVDKAMKYGPGFRWSWLGPLEISDLGGLEVFHAVASYLFKDLSNAEGPNELLTRMVEEGNLGLKTGQGFYSYDEDSGPKIAAARDTYFVRQLALQKKVKEDL